MKSLFFTTAALAVLAASSAHAQYGIDNHAERPENRGYVFSYRIQPDGPGWYATLAYNGKTYYLVKLSHAKPTTREDGQEILLVDPHGLKVSTAYDNAIALDTGYPGSQTDFACAKALNSQVHPVPTGAYTICKSRFGTFNPISSATNAILTFGIAAGKTVFFSPPELEKAFSQSGAGRAAALLENLADNAETDALHRIKLIPTVTDRTGLLSASQRRVIAQQVSFSFKAIDTDPVGDSSTANVAQQIAELQKAAPEDRLGKFSFQIECQLSNSILVGTATCPDAAHMSGGEIIANRGEIPLDVTVDGIHGYLWLYKINTIDNKAVSVELVDGLPKITNKTDEFMEVTAISVALDGDTKLWDIGAKIPPKSALQSNSLFSNLNNRSEFYINASRPTHTLAVSIEYVNSDGKKHTASDTTMLGAAGLFNQ